MSTKIPNARGRVFQQGTAEQTCREFSYLRVYLWLRDSIGTGRSVYTDLGPARILKSPPRVAAGETARKGEKRLLSEARVIRRPLRIRDSGRQRNDLRRELSM